MPRFWSWEGVITWGSLMVKRVAGLIEGFKKKMRVAGTESSNSIWEGVGVRSP